MKIYHIVRNMSVRKFGSASSNSCLLIAYYMSIGIKLTYYPYETHEIVYIHGN